MAPTLSLQSAPSVYSGEVHAPPPTQFTSLQQMPDVFVIPPEEEQHENPPWCYFDAQEAKLFLSTSPDIEALDVALGFFQQTDNRSPVFHRSQPNESQETIVMPKRSGTEVVDDEIGILSGSRSRGMDEDVVEVVKVRRNEGISDVSEARGQTIRKSRTFRARASQAFKSIKNVGRSRSKTSVTDVWPSESGEENHEGGRQSQTLPRSTTPNLTKRKSVQLSRMFSSTRSNRSSVVTEPPPSPTPRPAPSPSAETYDHIPPRPASSLSDRSSTLLDSQEDSQPTLSKKRSFRRRISVLDIQRLFSTSAPAPATPSTIRQKSFSRSPAPKRESVSLPLSRGPPQLPTLEPLDDDVFTSPSILPRPHSFHVGEARYSLALSTSTGTSGTSGRESEDNIPDTSLEMRLDSLHFDSLHFDPDEF